MGMLRTLLALSVVLDHLGGGTTDWLVGGRLAVQLFYVISGFLISYVLTATDHYRGAPGRFYANRALRLYPVYLAVAALTLLADVAELKLPWLAGYSRRVAALAVTTAQRSSLLADVPTVEESGIKGFDLGTWFGVFTTGGTPAPIVAKLNKAYSEAMQQPDVKQRLLTMGSEAAPMTPEAFAEFVKNEKAKYQEIVKISGASLN